MVDNDKKKKAKLARPLYETAKRHHCEDGPKERSSADEGEKKATEVKLPENDQSTLNKLESS